MFFYGNRLWSCDLIIILVVQTPIPPIKIMMRLIPTISSWLATSATMVCWHISFTLVKKNFVTLFLYLVWLSMTKFGSVRGLVIWHLLCKFGERWSGVPRYYAAIYISPSLMHLDLTITHMHARTHTHTHTNTHTHTHAQCLHWNDTNIQIHLNISETIITAI